MGKMHSMDMQSSSCKLLWSCFKEETVTIMFVFPCITTLLGSKSFQRCASQRRNKIELKFIANMLISAHAMYVKYVTNLLDIFLTGSSQTYI